MRYLNSMKQNGTEKRTADEVVESKRGLPAGGQGKSGSGRRGLASA